ncbi:MAG: hypothetical protein ACKVWR_02595 [Acidimicrobiales bacterium]
MRNSLRTALVASALSVGVLGAAAVAAPQLVGAQGDPAAASQLDPNGRHGRRGLLAQALNDLVAEGTLTEAQATAVRESLREQRSERRARVQERRQALRAAAAQTIGISEEELQAALQGGASLAEVAAQHGVAADALVASLHETISTRLAERVAAGEIDSARAEQIEGRLDEVLGRLVQRTRPRS